MIQSAQPFGHYHTSKLSVININRNWRCLHIDHIDRKHNATFTLNIISQIKSKSWLAVDIRSNHIPVNLDSHILADDVKLNEEVLALILRYVQLLQIYSCFLIKGWTISFGRMHILPRMR